MNKGLFLLLIVVITTSFYHIVKAFPEGILVEDYQFKENYTILTNQYIKELVFLPEASFHEDDAITMIENIGKINENILQLALQESIHVKLFTGPLTNQRGLGKLKNSKPRGYENNQAYWESVPGMSTNRMVYAKIGHSEFGKGHGSVSLELHEFAHAIDRYVFHYVRSNPVFINIWKQEADALFPFQDYFIRFPEEYFAETFAMYYYDSSTKQLLEQKAPLTFKFILSLEKNAEETVKVLNN
ncbi:anthrax toxin lethal factor-related metalloendopeptidase [Metabacillus sp. HB246100]|uniref:anthrax toxin lethal factor-related metalloendopeptidase n=1 Tax=Bacillus weihaiensis TaxID=1547283 RepID=UPI0023549276|nr:toxin [Bacillus weihaiensis]